MLRLLRKIALKVIYRFSTKPIKMPLDFLKFDNVIQKFIWNTETRVAKKL